MLKKIIKFSIISVGLFTLNPNSTLARNPHQKKINLTFYPSVCTANVQNQKHICNKVKIEDIRNQIAISVCNKSSCLIFVTPNNQVQVNQNQVFFNVNRMFLQRGNKITEAPMQAMRFIKCNIIINELSCDGKFANGNYLVVNVSSLGSPQRAAERNRNIETPGITPDNIRTNQMIFQHYFLGR